MAIYRTENTLFLWHEEDPLAGFTGGVSHWGTPADSPVYRTFGLHETFTAPDPDQAWTPWWGLNATRDRADILRGQWNLRGSVPDIRAQKRDDFAALLGMALGRFNSTSTQPDVNVIGEVLENQDDSGFDGRINSMTALIYMRDSLGNYSFVRQFTGGKVNRMTLSATEGQDLRCSVDEIIFKDVAHTIPAAANPPWNQTAKSLNGTATPSAPYGISDAERFLFMGATIRLGNTTLCRVKRFTLTIDNMLEPKYYLCAAASDPHVFSQTINDLVEGKRQYQLSIEFDVVDPSTDLNMFFYLMNQSTYAAGPTTGFDMDFNFSVPTIAGGSSGNMSIFCGLSPTATRPGNVITGGKINMPASPEGYHSAQYNLNLRDMTIAFN